MLTSLVKLVVVLLVAAGALLGCCGPPPQTARLVDGSGKALPTTLRAGVPVVTLTPGQTYEIFVENGTRSPLAVVVSVDGLEPLRGTPRDLTDATSAGEIHGAAMVMMPFTFTHVRGFDTGPTTTSTFRVTEPAGAFVTLLAASGVSTAPLTLGRIDVDFYPAARTARAASAEQERSERDDEPWVVGPEMEPAPAPAAGAGAEANVTSAAPAAPVRFGDVVTADNRVSDERWTIHGPALAHFTLLYEGEGRQALGTAGPPPRVVARGRAPRPVSPAPPPSERATDDDPSEPSTASAGRGKVPPPPKPPKPSKAIPRPGDVGKPVNTVKPVKSGK